ncbi:MAG: UDP-N-acetylglucosamine 2-epimerase (non-hydrolyzing) [Bacteroidales bacterium]|jgi:UDP-N-acetylglucosamine 2-epimerase (non-hydrolysing)
MKILSVVGARPNFMKIAPFCRVISTYNQKMIQGQVEHLLVHTGQHYDIRMSEAFFRDLDIPDPDMNLEIGSGSHAEQVGNTMIAFEKLLIERQPDWVVVVGDVNATLACSVTAKKLNIKVCHLEAGLRSGDMTMPEEINRLVTDRLSDLLLTPDLLSSKNLLLEGVPQEKVRFVGNIMIDTLESNRHKAELITLEEIISRNMATDSHFNGSFPSDDRYAVLTLHRPANVDSREVFEPLIRFLLDEGTNDNTLIWPIHPRALKQLEIIGLLEEVKENKNIILLEPVGYHDMLRLNMGARIMLTDSGGLQEECCVLGTPCLTLRWNTERFVTLRENGGASVLVGNNINRIRNEFYNTLSFPRNPMRPELWDGKTAERCLDAILNFGIEL